MQNKNMNDVTLELDKSDHQIQTIADIADKAD